MHAKQWQKQSKQVNYTQDSSFIPRKKEYVAARMHTERCIFDTVGLCFLIPLDTMGISLNKQKVMYNILTLSIIPIYKFLWTYGGSRHIITICQWLVKNT